MPRVFTMTYTQATKPDPESFVLGIGGQELHGEEIFYDWHLNDEGTWTVFLTSMTPLKAVLD